MPRIIGRILLTLAVFAVTGFVLLVLIGLWDRYEKEATALGFSGPYERYLASQAGLWRAMTMGSRPSIVSGTGTTTQM